MAFDQLGHGSARPGVAARLGIAVHLAVEKLLEGVDAERAWEAACSELTAQGADPRLLPGARRTELRFTKRAPELQALIEEFGPEQCLPEAELMSFDRTIGGTVDLLLLRKADLAVIDHKTGFVSEKGIPKAGFERQIRLYAGLAAETYGRPATRGVLMSMREGVVEVDVNPERVAVDLTAARAARTAYNERVPGPQPAVPSLANCEWCNHKAKCDAFWDAMSVEWRDQVGECVLGVVAQPPQLAQNGLGAVRIEVRRGTIEPARSVIIAEVPGAAAQELAQGEVVRVTGLRRTRSDVALRWSATSLLEVQNDDAR